MERAVRLLARRARTEAELHARLLAAAGASEGEVQAVLSRLKDLGFVNDGLFAYHTAASKLRMRPEGRARIARDLRLRKVPARAAGQALDEVYQHTTEEEQIDRAIARLLKVRGRPRSREESKKFYDRLVRLGFPYELALEKVKALASGTSIELDE